MPTGTHSVEPQRNWDVNEPAELATVLQTLGGQCRSSSVRRCRWPDLIVLGRSTAVEQAAKRAGFDVKVPFRARGARMRRKRRPTCTRLRCWTGGGWVPQLCEGGADGPVEELLVDKAQLLKLTAPEMTVLIGGFRVLAYGLYEAAAGADEQLLCQSPRHADAVAAVGARCV